MPLWISAVVNIAKFNAFAKFHAPVVQANFSPARWIITSLMELKLLLRLHSFTQRLVFS